jgi:hypothetical protein
MSHKYRDPVERLVRERERARAEDSPPPILNGAGEAEVVPGFQLAPVLRRFSKMWLAERPSGHDLVGPVQYLAQESGLNIRQVGRIVRGEIHFVGLDQAEKLLIAIGREDLLRDGTIWTVPNPNWSLEAWIEYKKTCDD